MENVATVSRSKFNSDLEFCLSNVQELSNDGGYTKYKCTYTKACLRQVEIVVAVYED